MILQWCGLVFLKNTLVIFYEQIITAEATHMFKGHYLANVCTNDVL